MVQVDPKSGLGLTARTTKKDAAAILPAAGSFTSRFSRGPGVDKATAKKNSLRLHVFKGRGGKAPHIKDLATTILGEPERAVTGSRGELWFFAPASATGDRKRRLSR